MWAYILSGLLVGLGSVVVTRLLEARWRVREVELKSRDVEKMKLGLQGVQRPNEINILYGARSWSFTGIAGTLFLGTLLMLFAKPPEIFAFLLSAALPQAFFWAGFLRRQYNQ